MTPLGKPAVRRALSGKLRTWLARGSSATAVVLPWAALVLAMLTALVQFPEHLGFLFRRVLPIARLWADPDAQYRLQLGAVPYDVLREADALLPRDVTLLLITPGRDVRHLEYITFHRALYFLTPRPVWWLSPAPSDGTWESRWWISAPLTPVSVLRVAADKAATCVLILDPSLDLPIGNTVASWDQGHLLQLNKGVRCRDPNAAWRPARLRPLWPAYLIAACGVIMVLGRLLLAGIDAVGYHTRAVETAALAWILGSGTVSLGMLGLNAAGLPLSGQVLTLTGLAVALGGWSVLGRTLRLAVAPPLPAAAVAPEQQKAAKRRLLCVGLLGLLLLYLILVIAMALGRPLDLWDSWVNWGMKARTILREGMISPALYADPSRAVTLQDYPLHIPLLEAWLYVWLGAPDDRLVGVPSVLFYLSLLGVAYTFLRRRGASTPLALGGTAVIAGLGPLAGLAGLVFPDLPLAVLATVAALYLVEWLDDGAWGALAISALAGGLMTWTKREGVALLAAMCLGTLLVGRGKRRRSGWAVLALLGAALALAGPWWAFTLSTGISNEAFLPVTMATFWDGWGRLPFILGKLGTQLVAPQWGYLWLSAAGLAIWQRLQPAARPANLAAPVALLLVAPAIYLTIMPVAYFFSAFVPYQQHVVSSIDRILAHAVPLPVLWIAGLGIRRASDCGRSQPT